jgi:hypothetical protein
MLSSLSGGLVYSVAAAAYSVRCQACLSKGGNISVITCKKQQGNTKWTGAVMCLSKGGNISAITCKKQRGLEL